MTKIWASPRKWILVQKFNRLSRPNLEKKRQEKGWRKGGTSRNKQQHFGTRVSQKGAQLSEVRWIARGTNYLFNGGLPTSLRGSGSGRKDGVVPGGSGVGGRDRWIRKTTYDVASDSGQASRRPTVFPKTSATRRSEWQIDVRRDRTIYSLPGDKRFLTKFRRDSGFYHYDPIVSS